MREINPKANVHLEKITNEPFDSIIGHSECERKYFTIENNDIIYSRFKNELSITCMPYLGPCIDFGAGDICLEESKENFKFYIIDRATKFELEEFNNIEDAIQKLISCYIEYGLVDDPDKMKKILFETLGISQVQEGIIKQKRKTNTK